MSDTIIKVSPTRRTVMSRSILLLIASFVLIMSGCVHCPYDNDNVERQAPLVNIPNGSVPKDKEEIVQKDEHFYAEDNQVKDTSEEETISQYDEAQIINVICLLYSCKSIPFYSFDSIDCVTVYQSINDSVGYKIHLRSVDKDYYIVGYVSRGCFYLEAVFDQNGQCIYSRWKDMIDYPRVNEKNSRDHSIMKLQEETFLSACDARMIMNEIDILFEAGIIDFYDISSVRLLPDEKTDYKEILMVSITGNKYIFKVSFANGAPIIQTVENEEGQIFFQCYEQKEVG